MAAVAVFYMTTLLFLFGKFYLGAYIFSKKPKSKVKKNKDGLYINDENKNKKML